MIAKPTIHPMAEQHLRELRERWGIEPDLSEALWIVQLCDRVLHPTGDRADLCGLPVRAGVSDVWLWPVTIGAGIFIEARLQRWYGGDNRRGTLALAWVLAHARDSQALRQAARGREFADALIDEWTAGLTCTVPELEAALDELLPPSPEKKDEQEPAEPAGANWPEIVRELEVITGLPADHWLWDISRDGTVSAWLKARAVVAAKAVGTAPLMLAEIDAALQYLATAKAAIIKAHKDADSEQ